jgi:hypothetical protein
LGQSQMARPSRVSQGSAYVADFDLRSRDAPRESE